MEGNLNLTLKIWRQKNTQTAGKFETYQVSGISTDMSFLEMIDVLNNRLIEEGDDPVAFDHDCREGICGMCSMYINGRPHGPNRGVTTCQLHMRSFKDGQTITVEPWRASAFPIIKDLGNVSKRSEKVGDRFKKNFDENLYGAEQMKASYKRQPQETIEVEGNGKTKGSLKSQGADKSSSINKATKILNTLESTEAKATKIINEDLQKMKNLISYNRKTQ